MCKKVVEINGVMLKLERCSRKNNVEEERTYVVRKRKYSMRCKKKIKKELKKKTEK